MKVTDGYKMLDSDQCVKDQNIVRFNKKVLKSLEIIHIDESQNFIDLFQKHKCDIPETYNFIDKYIEYYESKCKIKIEPYSYRSFKQTKSAFKDFFITLLTYKHGTEFIKYIRNKHSEYLPNITDIDNFVKSIDEMIQKVKQNSMNSSIPVVITSNVGYSNNFLDILSLDSSDLEEEFEQYLNSN